MQKEKIKFDLTEKKLLYDNILVRLVDVIKVDDAVYDPKQYSDKPEVGQVVSVGEGRLMDDGTVVPLRIRVGEIVLFNKYSTVKYRNPATSEDLYVVREEDIVAHDGKEN